VLIGAYSMTNFKRTLPSIRNTEGIVLDTFSIVVGRIDDFDLV